MTEHVEEPFFEDMYPSVPHSVIPYFNYEELREFIEKSRQRMIDEADSLMSVHEGMAWLRKEHPWPTA